MKTIFLIFAFCFMSHCSAQFISEDDILHFGAGAVVSGVTYSIIYNKTKNKKKAFWYSFGAATLIGLSKEIYDGFIISGRFDTGEMIATSFGGLVVSTSFNIFTGGRKTK